MREKLAVLVGLCLLSAGLVPTQPPELAWVGVYGGEGDEIGYAVEAIPGGYAIVGYTDSFGGGHKDIYLLELGPDGKKLWEGAFGGPDDEWGYDLKWTDDGYVIVGARRTSAGDKDIYLIKVDDKHKLRWQRTYGGTGDDVGYAVEVTPDGGYLIAGYTYSTQGFFGDLYLIKTDGRGRLLWERTYGGEDDDRGYALRITPEGDYLVLGYAVKERGSWGKPMLDKDFYLVKTNAEGEVIWERTYGGGGIDEGWALELTGDGYLLLGFTETDEGTSDLYLVKTDTEGNVEWIETYGGTGDDRGYAIQRDDKGYIITGVTRPSDGDSDLYLLKISPGGNLLWEARYGEEDYDEYGHDVLVPSEGGYLAIGARQYSSGISDLYVLLTEGRE